MGSIETVVGLSNDTLVSELKLGRPNDLSEFVLELAKDRSLDDSFLALGIESLSFSLADFSDFLDLCEGARDFRSASSWAPLFLDRDCGRKGGSAGSRTVQNSSSHHRKPSPVRVGCDLEWSSKSTQAWGSTRT
jgi:hypothetical protein